MTFVFRPLGRLWTKVSLYTCVKPGPGTKVFTECISLVFLSYCLFCSTIMMMLLPMTWATTWNSIWTNIWTKTIIKYSLDHGPKSLQMCLSVVSSYCLFCSMIMMMFFLRLRLLLHLHPIRKWNLKALYFSEWASLWNMAGENIFFQDKLQID